jgi:hypothetical protein
MKSSLSVLALGVLALVGSVADARPINDVTYYVPVFTDGTYTAQVNYNGSNSTIGSASIASSDALLTRFVTGLSNSYWSIRSNLVNNLTGSIAGSGASLTGLGQTGDIRIGIAGVTGGNLKMDISGLSWGLDVTATKSNWLGSVTCNSRIDLANVAFSSQYNPFTGAVSGTTINYTPSQSTSCDSSFSWIPFVGDFINRKAGNIVGSKILDAANAWSGKVFDVNPQKALFGFTDAIAPNTYMVGGLDAGMYLKNNLQNLYVGKRVDIFIANEYKYEPIARQPAPGTTAFSGNRFSIMFSDASTRVGFSVNANKNYRWEQRILGGTNGPACPDC